jgi:osmotically-inducible protein OsmY
MNNANRATITDTDLENSIKAKLDANDKLRAADLDVDADINNNEVVLTGTVESQETRMQAVEIAKGAHPGIVVTDKIDVEPRDVPRAQYTEEQAREERERAESSNEKVGASLDDAWIHMKIVAQLIGDPDTPKRKINVDVVDNVVTLRGAVDTQQEKTEAERIARETEGVKRVNSQLKVGGTTSAGR